MEKVNDTHSGELEDAMANYQEKFDDLPTIMGLPLEQVGPRLAKLLNDAVKSGKPLSDEDVYDALGMEAPPDDADI